MIKQEIKKISQSEIDNACRELEEKISALVIEAQDRCGGQEYIHFIVQPEILHPKFKVIGYIKVNSF